MIINLMVISEPQMAGAEEDDRDAVLAFLLGSTSDLGAAATVRPCSAAAVNGPAAVEDDPPVLEPVSDSEEGPETDTTTSGVASGSEAAASCDSEETSR